MIQPQLLECMHIQSSNNFSFINFLKKTGITEGSNTFWRSTLVFMHLRILKLFFAFSQCRRYTILFWCIVVWFLSDNLVVRKILYCQKMKSVKNISRYLRGQFLRFQKIFIFVTVNTSKCLKLFYLTATENQAETRIF